jgi:SAM-dependent methyltransferase
VVFSVWKGSDLPSSQNLVSAHYDAEYAAYQDPIGVFGGWANKPIFAPFLAQTDTVLDFGCGGGYLLRGLDVAKKIGIEPEKEAASLARKGNEIEVYEQASDVPEQSVDIVISFHALEHTLHPLTELKSLLRILRLGGKIVIVVPCENISSLFRPGDINHHLYSWSPMCLGNLMTEAGFTVLESKPYIHKWPPRYEQVAALMGRFWFDVSCRIYGQMSRRLFQVRAVGERPAY